MSEEGPFSFLYAEQASDPELGEPALLPGFRPTFTNRGLPDLEPHPDYVTPGILWAGVLPAPEAPFKGTTGHAVLATSGTVGGVIPVLLRRQRRDGEPARASRELMEQVRDAAAACGHPLAWVTEGIPLDKIDENFGKAVGARVRSVADRVSRGVL